MSSASSLSSIDLEDPQQRLQGLWKSIKQTRNIHTFEPSRKHSASLRSGMESSPDQQTKLNPYHPEQQLEQMRENTAMLLNKLREAQDQADAYKFKFNQLKKETKYKIEGLMQELKGREKENISENRDAERETLENKLEQKEKEVEKLALKLKSLEFEKRSMESEMKRIKAGSERKQPNIEMQTVPQNHGAQLLELDEAYRTIERLTNLLKSTPKFKSVGNFAQDHANIHFLKNIPKRLKSGQLGHHPGGKCSCMEVRIDERLLWTSTTCYKVMLEMKMKYDSLTQDCIEETLFQLNKLYLGHEESRLKKMQVHHDAQVSKLKKRLEETYDELLAKKQINRLKKELRAKTVAKPTKKKLCELKNVGQYEDQLKLKNKQIRLLQERIKLIEAETEGYERNLYYQGALWIAEKTLSEVSANEGILKQFEVQFRQRMSDNCSPEDWLRSYKQFFESLADINNVLMDKLLTIRENASRKIAK